MNQGELLPLRKYSEEHDNDNYENDSDITDNDSDEEIMEQGEPTTCLFCSRVLASIELALEHVKVVHKVNFALLKAQFGMDQYSYIKLINCIRVDSITEDKLQNIKTAFWTDEKYLKPIGYEPWLSYDFDGLETPISEGCLSNESNLESLVHELQEQVKLQQDQLKQASQDMEIMRKGFHRLMEKESKEVDQNSKGVISVSSLSLKADEGYFESYAHYGIHHEMLSDVVRTTSYRDALLKNKEFVKGKHVLDVGCGTSILSIFASQAGAAKVVGIDNSDIVYNAMDIVKKNNIENVTLVKGRLEDTNALVEEKFDIIVSEWMGYFLLFEGMLDSVIFARDHHLKENGMILPNRCTLSILGYGNKSLFENHVTFWNNVYGLDMSNMRREAMHEPLIDIVDAEHILKPHEKCSSHLRMKRIVWTSTLTEANCIADLDLMKIDISYSNFKHNFELTCCKDGELYSFVGYFDTYFDLPEPVMFGTSPKDKPTHWKQVVFFIEQAQEVKKGDVIKGVLQCKRSHKSARSLDIVIEAFNKKYTYYID